MSKLGTLYKNINVINIILTVTLVIFVLYGVLPLLNADLESPILPLREGAAEAPDKSKETFVKKPVYQSDYVNIADRNLFHPERKIPEPVAETEEAVVERPEFVLYGTMVIGDVQVAYMEDMKSPLTTPGRGKRQNALKKGDSLGGYTLSEVHQDRVLMVKGEDSIEVNIIDPSKPKSRSVGGATTVEPKKVPAKPPTKPPTRKLRDNRRQRRSDRSRG